MEYNSDGTMKTKAAPAVAAKTYTPPPTLEQRVVALEAQVAALQALHIVEPVNKPEAQVPAAAPEAQAKEQS